MTPDAQAAGIPLDGIRPAAGEMVALLGASGSGRSHALRGVADAARLTGSVAVVGADTSVQMSGLADTVEHEIALALEQRGIDRARMHARVHAVAELMGLSGELDRDPASLSGGRMQLVALAAGLVTRPGLLVLDDATRSLDPAAAAALGAALRAARDQDPDLAVLVTSPSATAPLVREADRTVSLGAERTAGLLAASMRAQRDAQPDRPLSAREETGPRPEPVATLRGAAIDRGGRRRLLRPGRSRVTRAVQGLDLTLRRGEFVALTGPNGSGKSSLLSALAGAVPLAAGSRTLNGRVQMVDQDPSLSFLAATTEAEAGATARLLGIHPVRDRWDEEAIEHVGTEHPLDLPAAHRTALAISAARVASPALLLLDEPTAATDARWTAWLAGAIAASTAGGCTVLAATHDAELVALADRRIALPPRAGTLPSAP